MQRGGDETAFNLGTGTGYSVLEVIESARRITNKETPARIEDRRAGDPAILIADGRKAQQLLDWTPTYSDLNTIIETAWKWEQHLSNI